MQQIRTVTVATPDRLDHQTRPLAPGTTPPSPVRSSLLTPCSSCRISNRFFSIPVRRLQSICFHQFNSIFRQIFALPARQQQSHQIPPQTHETTHLIKYWTIKIQSAKSCRILQKSAHFRQKTPLFRQISTFSCKLPASFTHHPASLQRFHCHHPADSLAGGHDLGGLSQPR